MILALDLGTQLGFYLEGTKEAETYKLGKGDERFHNFRMFLIQYTDTYHYGNFKILYEGAAHQRGMAMPLWHGLVGVLKEFCYSYGIEYEDVHAMTMKKVFTGKGKWSKKDCMKIAEERDFKSKYKGGKTVFSKKAPVMAMCEDLGYTFDTDNAADAIGVYHAYKKLNNQ